MTRILLYKKHCLPSGDLEFAESVHKDNRPDTNPEPLQLHYSVLVVTTAWGKLRSAVIVWLIVIFVADLKMRWALGSLLLALAHPSSSSARRNSRRMLISEAPTASEYVNVQEGRQGRQIQPLACVSKSGGEKGVCMFAWNCVEAGGQHLGTCIDR